MASKKIGFLGFGQMGFAIAQGLFPKVLNSSNQIFAYDPSTERCKLAKQHNFQIIENFNQLSNVDIVVLSVKPFLAKETCANILPYISNKLIVSVMAGVTVDSLRQFTENKARICRVLTSLAASVGQASSAFTMCNQCTEDDKQNVTTMLESFGLCVGMVPDSCLDVTMAIAGSGPALISIVIEALADAGVSHGLNRDISIKLAAGMVKGTASLVLEKEMHPAQLKDAVCSPAGISIKAVEQIEKGAVRSSFIDAIHFACKRSKELS